MYHTRMACRLPSLPTARNQSPSRGERYVSADRLFASYDTDSDDDDQSYVDHEPSSAQLAVPASSSREAVAMFRPPPKKRRMSNIDRPAVRVKDGSVTDVTTETSFASSSSDLYFPSARLNYNPNTMPNPLAADFKYPEWLQSLLQDRSRPTIALGYEVSSSETGRQHATLTPLRCYYARPEDGALKHREFGFKWAKDGSRIAIGETAVKTVDSAKAPALLKSARSRKSSASSRRGFNSRNDEAPVYSKHGVADHATINTSKIPVEIWENIIQHLSREDTKSLRLVNKDVERCTSGRLFKTVVVPFTTDIYGVLSELPVSDTEIPSSRGTTWMPKSTGLDIFRGFGRHVRKFGMSFEIDETSLSHPPSKALQQGHESYWGTYSWPFPQYARFKDRADLEVTADETSTMTLAFSHLKEVQHLALSLDCGLGWLGGPDMSLRARFLRSRGRIFGVSFCEDTELVAQRQLWSLLEESYRFAGHRNLIYEQLVRIDVPDLLSLRQMICNGPSVRTAPRIVLEANLGDALLGTTSERTRKEGLDSNVSGYSTTSDVDEISGFLASRHDLLASPTRTTWGLRNRKKSASAEAFFGSENIVSAAYGSQDTRPTPKLGVLYTRPIGDGEVFKQPTPTFVPGQLTTDQKEWLLESAWAQDAFLSSYLLAVADNASSFRNVKSLTITRLSSRHLPKYCRNDFWNSLPSLENLDLRVIADHRDVRKTQSGFVDAPSIRPSDAISPFSHILSHHISHKASIKKLCIGWADGGEHAEGLFARNNHILPAPLSPNPLNVNEASWRSHLLRLPHVQDLTLVNCWITPNALKAFLEPGVFVPKLRQLQLESVSLTAHPRFEHSAGNNGVHGLLAMLMQQLANLNLPLPPLQGQTAGMQAQALVNALAQAQALGPHHQTLLGNFLGHAQAVQAIHNAIMQQQGFGVAVPPQLHQQPQQLNPIQPREGSWPDVLNRLKAGREGDTASSIRMSFLSCGYVLLPSPAFDQTSIDEAEAENKRMNAMSAKARLFFNTRKSVLTEFMMGCQDPLLGRIALGLTAWELETLKSVWGFEEGWPSRSVLGRDWERLDEGGWGKWGVKTKQAPEYDGARLGGTGRFSGLLSGDAVDV